MPVIAEFATRPHRRFGCLWIILAPMGLLLAVAALFAFFADKQAVYHLCSSAFICGLLFLINVY